MLVIVGRHEFFGPPLGVKTQSWRLSAVWPGVPIARRTCPLGRTRSRVGNTLGLVRALPRAVGRVSWVMVLVVGLYSYTFAGGGKLLPSMGPARKSTSPLGMTAEGASKEPKPPGMSGPATQLPVPSCVVEGVYSAV